MAAMYKPIAGLSPDNYGPINTIVSIILIVTSLLFSSVRYAIGRKTILELDIDDGVFGVALILSVAMSVMSQQMVNTGLGRHKDSLSSDQLSQFYKLQYATQFLAVMSMTFAKMSMVFMFRRIIPRQQAPLILKVLMPIIVGYATIALFLVAFQCQLPKPWILSPASCSTHGRVYYVTTVLNILTDAVLAFWILPTILALQMRKGTKAVVIALFASRLIICAADIGRMVVIHRSLQSKDSTWATLGWAIMDQVVIHLSVNHATLPRIHVFLGNLQTGLIVTRLTAGDTLNTNSKGTRPTGSDHNGSIPLSSTTASSTSRRSKKNRLMNPFNSDNSKHSVSLNQEANNSKTQLRLQPDQEIELSTFVSTGEDESTSIARGEKGKGKWEEEWRL